MSESPDPADRAQREVASERRDDLDLEAARRVHRLLVAALERPPQERREAVLAGAGIDSALAAEVLSLLEGQNALAGFLERPAAVDLRLVADETDIDPARDDAGHAGGRPAATPERIGPYTVLERIGSGGMGEVFRARQEEPVRREVALKRIHAHLAPESRARFLAEQRALARLGHTNVARFYAAGTTADGQPYFAMELLEGLPLTTHCDRESLPVAARLRLFLDVCAGVEHAHQRQILHRDLKPSNVIVVEESGRAVPKVIDFGIAKSLQPADGGLTLEPDAHILGTPAYMSPEALEPRRAQEGLDTRADVYSLGVLLFELLTGRTPFVGEEPGLLAIRARREAASDATPSQRLRSLDRVASAEVAARRGTTAPALVRSVAGDLDGIVARAIAPDRERRYGSVGELAADVARHLADQPIVARPPSARYRLGKLVRRHRGWAAATVVAAAGLLLGVAGLGLGWVQSRREAAATREALEESQALSGFLVGLFDASRPGSKPPDQISAQDLLERGAETLDSQLSGRPVARGRMLCTLADVYTQMGRHDEAGAILGESERLLRSLLPPGDPDIARVIRSRGVLAFHRGEWREAELLLRAGLAPLDPAEEPEEWALAVHNIGVAMLSRGEIEAAKQQLLRALDVRLRYLPPDHPHLARSYSALGTVELREGNFERSIANFEKALALRRKLFGPDHAYVALALKNLAMPELRLGRDAEAEAALVEAVAIQERALPPDHPDRAEPLATLGALYTSQGLTERAATPLRRAFDIRRAALGETHPFTVTSMRHLGRNLLDLGRLEEAEPLLRRALELQEAEGGRESSLEFPRLYVGLLALARGELARAEPIFEQALTVWRRDLGPENPNLSWPMLGLATIHQKRGELDAAEQFASEALRLRREAYPEDHPWVVEAREQYREIAAAGPGGP